MARATSVGRRDAAGDRARRGDGVMTVQDRKVERLVDVERDGTEIHALPNSSRSSGCGDASTAHGVDDRDREIEDGSDDETDEELPDLHTLLSSRGPRRPPLAASRPKGTQDLRPKADTATSDHTPACDAVAISGGKHTAVEQRGYGFEEKWSMAEAALDEEKSGGQERKPKMDELEGLGEVVGRDSLGLSESEGAAAPAVGKVRTKSGAKAILLAKHCATTLARPPKKQPQSRSRSYSPSKRNGTTVPDDKAAAKSLAIPAQQQEEQHALNRTAGKRAGQESNSKSRAAKLPAERRADGARSKCSTAKLDEDDQPALARSMGRLDLRNGRQRDLKKGGQVRDTQQDGTDDDVLDSQRRRKNIPTSMPRSGIKQKDDEAILQTQWQPRPPHDPITCKARNSSPPKPANKTVSKTKIKTATLVLSQADCKDDQDDNGDDQDDEDTDLSGFIVDDDVELTIYDPTESDGERRADRTTTTRRRDVEGPERRRNMNSSDEPAALLPFLQASKVGNRSRKSKAQERGDRLMHRRGNQDGDCRQSLTDHIGDGGVEDLGLGQAGNEHPSTLPHRSWDEIEARSELIDLTSSPVKPSSAVAWDGGGSSDDALEDLDGGVASSVSKKAASNGYNKDDEDDAILRFSPPRRRSPIKIETGKKQGKPTPVLLPASNGNAASSPENTTSSRTPPHTPPTSPIKPTLGLGSPTKLKSPTKNRNKKEMVFSPGKQVMQSIIPQSPHRQSVDAFWSSEVINEWNEEYSPPKKDVLTISPRKRFGLDRWRGQDVDANDSGSEVESRSESPGKARKGRSLSPARRKKSEAVAKKKRFDAVKIDLAQTFLTELDDTVSNGRLARLCQSTGGVKIVWSKTLRSTAGRANWKRSTATTTTTTTEPPSSSLSDRPGKVDGARPAGHNDRQTHHHHASIELAEKIIDDEERLVNTLAHEYCHLANFMLSGVRDQPHGASFKQWASRVTSTLLEHATKPIYGAVRVTTKHSYPINHRYLWICTGRPLDHDDGHGGGCGTEYGRHSRSIRPDRHRCGRCGGLLVQLRPKPRPAGSRLEGAMEAVAIQDG